ncbi:PDZ domain-containing protein [Streptomyces sp. A012304]|uniref:PDZ domain-containing protein n=1 Tax=Streptomyces sp. A012304 TaxID=375446 RepID=UPI0022327B8F|nr:PDZ domain-containing protein [Streptomyces sp. A012304]GKQ37401.1 hypothetical protein ALMP_39390 [Streptomyces sp. A012304]
MEHTALRPKPLPGRHPDDGGAPGGPNRRPHAARRRGRRLTTLLSGLLVGTVLVLSGVGLGTVGATVIGMRELAELKRQAGRPAPGTPGAATGQNRPSPSPPADTRTPSRPPVDATLGVEAVDARGGGAEIVAVHVPGPGFSAGLVRGDVLLAFGRVRIDSATDLAHAVDEARPGRAVQLTVRHRSGAHQRLAVVPGVVT